MLMVSESALRCIRIIFSAHIHSSICPNAVLDDFWGEVRIEIDD